MSFPEGTFTAAGQVSAEIEKHYGTYDLSLVFSNSGVVRLECKYVGSDTWWPAEELTETSTRQFNSHQPGTRYRLYCVSVTGAIDYRLGGS